VLGLAAALVSTLTVEARAHEGLEIDIEQSSEAIRQHPQQFEHRLERGQLLRLAGRLPESLRDLEQARRLAPHEPRVLLQTGITLAALGRTQQAEQTLTACVAHGGRWARTFAELATVYARRNRANEAIAAYSESLRLKPDVEVYLAFGKLFESLGRVGEARDVYRAGVAKTQAELLTLALVRVELASGRPEIAMSLIDEALALAPVKTGWLLRRAQVSEVMGEPRLARTTRQQALREAHRVVQRHGSSIAFTQRATVYLELGFRDAARRDVERALALSPRYPAALDLAQTLERQSLPQGTP
jgi:tetratricopeptide (TPR) repeat protein